MCVCVMHTGIQTSPMLAPTMKMLEARLVMAMPASEGSAKHVPNTLAIATERTKEKNEYDAQEQLIHKCANYTRQQITT